MTLSSACLALLGVDFESSAEVQEGTLQFGTSVDRTLTAVVASLPDADKASYVRGMLDPYAFEVCTDDPALTYDGEPVDAQVTVGESDVTGADEADSVRLDATIDDSAVSVIGQVAQVDNNLILVVGWDPSTNERNSPLATQMFIDAIAGES
ncbi:hypothetical protein [Microbacterium sorbitolivorans]|uniref:hypothetical protein n=1 Tax=Microbacterium sorbitolivorans TaxID=1867410 RepID=UPI0013B06CF9|nr:hypothetical protein [Microbacterium sorbitolivorans]